MQTRNFAAPNLPLAEKHGGLIFVLGLDVAFFLGSLAGQLAQLTRHCQLGCQSAVGIC